MTVRDALRLCLPPALLVLSMALVSPCLAQELTPDGTTAADDLELQLITFGPGDLVHQYFGHNALNVVDKRTGSQLLYNFGMFSFGPTMIPSFLRGRLWFWIGTSPTEPTFQAYREHNRSIDVSVLNLLPAQRAEMLRRLEAAVAPENRDYLYDHYTDNCSTRLRDLIDDATRGQFREASARPARFTWRGDTRRYAQKDPLIDMLLVFAMNDEMEQPKQDWDEMFLPQQLERQLDAFQYRDTTGNIVPMVSRKYAVFAADRPPVPDAPATSWPYTLLFGASFGALAVALANIARRRPGATTRALFGAHHTLAGIVFGIPGSLLFLIATMTEHHVTYHNENLLLANPVTLLSAPLGVAIMFGSQRALRVMRFTWRALAASSLLAITLKLLPNFDQDTLLPMTLIVPTNLGFALAHHSLFGSASKRSATGRARDTPPRTEAVDSAGCASRESQG